MRKLLTIFMLLLSVFAFGQGANTTIIDVPIATPSIYPTTAGLTEKCILTLPASYASNPTKKYPIMVFFHGAGEAGSNPAAIYGNSGSGGPAYFVNTGTMPTSFINPADGQPYEFIFASPQFNGVAPGFQTGIGSTTSLQADTILGYLIKTYRVDTSRIYFTGLSAGGQTIVTYVNGYYADLSNGNGNLIAFTPKHKPACYIPMSAVIPQIGSTFNDQTVALAAIAQKAGLLCFGSPWTDTHGANSLSVAWFANNAKAGYTQFSMSYSEAGHPTTTYYGYAYAGGHGGWGAFYNPNFNGINGERIYEYALKFTQTPTFSPTTASAGGNQSISIACVSSANLLGSASAATGQTISSHGWKQTSGVTATIADTTSYITTVSGLAVGTYKFRLRVTDNAGTSAYDTATITVAAALHPTISAGTNQSITLPTNSVTLGGSATSNDCSTIPTKNWTQVSGPNTATITGSSTLTPTMAALVAGTYVFQFTTVTNAGLTDHSNVTVTVAASGSYVGHNYLFTLSGNDQGKFSTMTSPIALQPGDTITLDNTYRWTYASFQYLVGTQARPIVIINKGLVDMTAGIALYDCQYVKVTGTGDPAHHYGFYVHGEMTVNPVSRGNTLQISGLSHHIEMEFIDMWARTYAMWAKDEVTCYDSINNSSLHDLKIHDIRAKNINQDGFYIGSTSPGGERAITCNAIATTPSPQKLFNIEIYNIILDSVGRTGIQMSGAMSGTNSIHDCHVTRTGFENNPSQGSGIILGGYTTAKVYNNYVRNTYQHGVSVLGAGVCEVYNNDIDSSGMLQFPGVDTVTKNPGYTCISVDTRATTSQWPNTVFTATGVPLTSATGPAIPLTLSVHDNKVGVNDQFDNTLGDYYQIRIGAGFNVNQPWTTANSVYNNKKQDGVTPAVFGVNANIAYSTGGVTPPPAPCNCLQLKIPITFH